MTKLSRKEEIKAEVTASFPKFIKLVQASRELGEVHVELCRWLTRPDAKTHQLVLLPRDHQKSAIAGLHAAWQVIRNPAIRILYISSTANLAVKQLKFIKDILTSDIVRFYWPELVNVNEGQREKWTETEISVDHPLRKAQFIRDPTIFSAGLTTNIVGMHCDYTYMDDVVVYDNAYTEDGRTKTKSQYSLLASIEGTEGRGLIVGTTYFENDLYADLQAMKVILYNDEGEITSEDPLYEIFGGDDHRVRQVEDRGDGTGNFLWPKRPGSRFGFNAEILARKKAQYLDPVQFRAQYYNDPYNREGAGIKAESFQYYDKKFLERQGGYWYVKQSRLNIFAAIDFAFSLSKKADYTSIVVVGVNRTQDYYVLDIDRFKTSDIGEYFAHILRSHQKWGFRKLRAEVTGGQTPIVESLKKDHIRVHNLALSIDEFRPTRNEGTKEERINAVLRPKYSNLQIWHYQGGLTQALEEELLLSKPPHDDIKDALAAAIDVSVAPTFGAQAVGQMKSLVNSVGRFGGIT